MNSTPTEAEAQAMADARYGEAPACALPLPEVAAAVAGINAAHGGEEVATVDEAAIVQATHATPEAAAAAYRRRLIERAAAELVQTCHGASVAGGWWHDLATGERLKRNVPEMLCLIHSEVSEAVRAQHHLPPGQPDAHLPQFPAVTVELADAAIRIFDLAGGLFLPLGQAMADIVDDTGAIPDRIEEMSGLPADVTAACVVLMDEADSYALQMAEADAAADGSDPQATPDLAVAFNHLHSEISLAMEGVRKQRQDAVYKQHKAVTVALAYATLRIFSIAMGLGANICDALPAKLAYNAERADHKPANRLLDGGKAF